MKTANYKGKTLIICPCCEGLGEVSSPAYHGETIFWDEQIYDCIECDGTGFIEYEEDEK